MANVPNVAGIPALLTGFAAGGGTSIALMVADAVGALFGGSGPQWGIFLGGANVISADTVAAFEHKRDFAISDYPVERGGFETYDKVQMPQMPRIRFTSGMNSGNVASLLSSIDAASKTYNLYDVVTPTAVYTSVNIHHYDYRRSAENGAGMVTVDVWLEEVRVSITAGASSSSTPSTPNSPSTTPATPSGVGTIQGSGVSSFNTQGAVAPSGFSPTSTGNIQGSGINSFGINGPVTPQ